MHDLGTICCPPGLRSASPTGAVPGGFGVGVGMDRRAPPRFPMWQSGCRVTVNNQTARQESFRGECQGGSRVPKRLLSKVPDC